MPNLGILGLFNRSEEWMAGTGLRGAVFEGDPLSADQHRS